MGGAVVLWLELLGFTFGLVMLLLGAEGVVRGGSGLARRLGVSPLLIGLTIVALGTSAPELVVSATAAKFGDPEIALGNVLGSNIMNILIVLGITGLLRPMRVSRGILEQDLPILFVVTTILWMTSSESGIGAFEAAIMLLLIPAYLVRLYQREKNTHHLETQVEEELGAPLHPVIGLIAIAGGVALLVFGGRWVVDSGIIIAGALGIPERVVAITLVAFGTSAPELATSVMAAFRGKADLAIGNAVGSNFLNLYLVLGVSATITNLPVARGALLLDFPVAIGAILLLWIGARKGVLTRGLAALMVAGYGGYLAILFSGWV